MGTYNEKNGCTVNAWDNLFLNDENKNMKLGEYVLLLK